MAVDTWVWGGGGNQQCDKHQNVSSTVAIEQKRGTDSYPNFLHRDCYCCCCFFASEIERHGVGYKRCESLVRRFW